MVIDENPYKPPMVSGSAANAERHRAKRSTHVRILFGAALSGAMLGSLILAPVCRGPGDPAGHSISARIGGFIGLFCGLSYIFLSRDADGAED